MFENIHFHSHPSFEKAHKIPSDHVVIDLLSYQLIERMIKEEQKIIQVKRDKEVKYDSDEPYGFR